MAIDPNAIKLASPIESTAVDNTAVYSEQVYSAAGIPFDQLIDAKTTFNTTNAVYLSARGSDANSGRTALVPVATWQRAYLAATASSDHRPIVIPDDSLVVVDGTYSGKSITVQANRGARLTGSFTVAGHWSVSHLGALSSQPDTISLAADCLLRADSVTADIADKGSPVHNHTLFTTPRLDGDITLSGSGTIHITINVADGTHTIAAGLNVQGWIGSQFLGWDFSRLSSVFRIVQAKDMVTEQLEVTDKIVNPELDARLDKITAGQPATVSSDIPAGEFIPARTPVAIASTAAGDRYYQARDRTAATALALRDVYTAAEQADSRKGVQSAQVLEGLTVDATREADKENLSFYVSDTLGIAAWHDTAADNITLQAMGRDAGIFKPWVLNPSGNSFQQYNFDVSPRGTIWDLVVIGRPGGTYFYVIYSSGTKKELRSIPFRLSDDGVVTFSSELPMVSERQVDALDACWIGDDYYAVGHYSRLGGTRTIEIYRMVTDIGTQRRSPTSWGSGAAPAHSEKSLAVFMSGDDLMYLFPENNGVGVRRETITNYRVVSGGDSMTENQAIWRDSNGLFVPLEDWGATFDGVRVYFTGRPPTLVDGVRTGTAAVSAFLDGNAITPEHIVVNLFANPSIKFETHTPIFIETRNTDGTVDSVVQALAIEGDRDTWSSQVNTPTIATSYADPVGVTIAQSAPGYVPKVAFNSEPVTGFTGLIPSTTYFLAPDGTVGPEDATHDVSVYYATSTTGVLVTIAGGTSRTRRNAAQLTAISRRLQTLEQGAVVPLAGEFIPAFTAVNSTPATNNLPAQLYPARDTSDDPVKEVAAAAIYTDISGTITDTRSDSDFFGSSTVRAVDLDFGYGSAWLAEQSLDSGSEALTVYHADLTSIADKDDALRAEDANRLIDIPITASCDYVSITAIADNRALLLWQENHRYMQGYEVYRPQTGSGLLLGPKLLSFSPYTTIATGWSTRHQQLVLVARQGGKVVVYVFRRPATGFHSLSTYQFLSWPDVAANDPITEGRLAVGAHEGGYIVFHPGSSTHILARRLNVGFDGSVSLGNESNGHGTTGEYSDWDVVLVGSSAVIVGVESVSGQKGEINIEANQFTMVGGTPVFGTQLASVQNYFRDTTDLVLPGRVAAALDPTNDMVEFLALSENTARKGQVTTHRERRNLEPILGWCLQHTEIGDQPVLGYAGQLVEVPSGLPAGTQHYIQDDGTIDTDDTGTKLFRTVSDTWAVLNYPI